MPLSARKLAASFWEHNGGLKLDKDDDEPEDLHTTAVGQNCHSLLSAPLSTLRYPALADCEASGSLKFSSKISIGENGTKSGMAVSQAATLVNVLHRMRSIEEGQNRSMGVLNKLRLDVDSAASRIQELEYSHKSILREMNNLLQRIGEQMAVSRRKEQEKVRLTFLHLHEEMEEERNNYRLLQRHNKKLSEDLTHANLAAADACEELNRERKARELLEEVCNELAREIGEDKAEVEQLKQEQEESRERLEKELKLMRMVALWREQKVRNKLEEAKLELEYGGKQGMLFHETQGNLEVMDNVAVVGECSTFQQEIKNQEGQSKCLTQVLERKESDNTTSVKHNMENVSCSACPSGVPAWLDAHFSKESSLNIDFNPCVDTVNTSDIEQRVDENGAKKHRKLRQKLHASIHQEQILGVKDRQAMLYDGRSSGFWGEDYCKRGVSSSSDDEVNGKHLLIQQSFTPQKRGLLVKADLGSRAKAYDNVTSVVGDGIDRTLNMQERKPQVISSFGSHGIVEKGLSCLDSLLNDASRTCSPKNHSSSARFEVKKLSFTSEADAGRRIQHYFSDDDASSYIASRTERRRRQYGRMSRCLRRKRPSDQAGLSLTNNTAGISVPKDRGGGEVAGGHHKELDDVFFEPVRGPTLLHYDKMNGKTNRDEEVVNKSRPERALGQSMALGKCGDDPCCGIMSKCGQLCKEPKADDKSGCGMFVASQDAESTLIPGGQDNTSKFSPWRSATGKPLQCLWPPSPDAFSTFGGSKRQVKVGSSIPVNVGDEGSLAQRQRSPAKQAVHLQVAGQKPSDFPSMRSNSLGAQLIKARVCDSEKPPKMSFRFSPLRRATSHG